MTTNDIIAEVHDAAIDKLAEKCEIAESNREAICAGRDLMEYGRELTAAYGDDGKISDEEKARIRKRFRELVLTHIPSYSGASVNLAWNGLSFFGIGWQGIKSYFNRWFNLGL